MSWSECVLQSYIGHIVGFPGADSGSEGKYKRAETKIGAMKSKERGIFPARFIYFPSPPLSAPGYPRMLRMSVTSSLPSDLVEPWGPGKKVVL